MITNYTYNFQWFYSRVYERFTIQWINIVTSLTCANFPILQRIIYLFLFFKENIDTLKGAK